MAVTYLSVGSTSSKVAGSSTTVTFNQNAVPANTLLVLAIACDNATATAPTISSVGTVGSTAWTAQAGAVSQSGASSTAGSGVFVYCYTTFTTTAIALNTSFTITFSASTVARAAVVSQFSEMSGTLRNTVVAAASAAGTPSAVTTGTALVAGDLVIGVDGCENNAIDTVDTDTLNGAWQAANSTATTGGQAAANIAVSTQYKVVTATGAQTFNPGGLANDAVAIVFAMQPAPVPAITQAAYRFYADGTETASTALAAENTAYTADVTAGDVNLLVRTRLQLTTAVATNATDDWQLQFEKNGSGTWNDIISQFMIDSYSFGTTTAPFGVTFTAVGESIMGNGQKLVQVQSDLFKTGTPPGNVFCRVYAHSGTFGSGGVPTGSPLATSTSLACTALPTAAGTFMSYNFDGSFTLVSGTPYFLVFTTDTTLSGPPDTITANKGTGGVPSAGNGAELIGPWTSVTADYNFIAYTSSEVPPFASTNLTDAAATTNRLTAGTGTFVAGKVSEDGIADNIGWSASNYTELLYSVTLKSANLANADTIRFRVLYNGATTRMTYTQTPTLNITKTVTGYPKVYLAGAFTKKPLKVYSGASFVAKPVKQWTGSTWKTLT